MTSSNSLDIWKGLLDIKDERTKDFLDACEEVKKIFADGEVQLTELPALSLALSKATAALAALLRGLAVDPRASVILQGVVILCDLFSKKLEAGRPGLERAWGLIDDAVDDSKVSLSEVPQLLEGISDILKFSINFLIPFVSIDFTDALKVLNEKIQKVMAVIPHRKESKK